MPLNINGYIVNDFNVRQYYYDMPIKNGLVLHLDCGIFNTIPYSGGDTWYDLSGEDNHGVFVNNFSFSSDFGGILQTDGSTTFAEFQTPDLSTSNFSLFAITRYTPGETKNGRIISGNGNNYIFGHHAGQSERWFSVGWVNQPTNSDGDEWKVYTGIGNVDSDLYTFYVNNSQVASNNGGSAGPDGFEIGRFSSGTEYSYADFGVFLVYNRLLDESERTFLYNFYRERYGI
jgi:hypothetical protein